MLLAFHFVGIRRGNTAATNTNNTVRIQFNCYSLMCKLNPEANCKVSTSKMNEKQNTE
jgi:hypothetical protein